MQEKEAGQTELVDQLQLLVKAGASLLLVSVAARVPLREGVVTNSRQLRDRGLAVLREVGIAVAEVLVQVEPEALGELAGALDRVAVMGEELRDLGRRPQEALAVTPPLGLAAVERRAVLDGDKGVLQRRPTRIVRMDIAGRDGLDAQHLGQLS